MIEILYKSKDIVIINKPFGIPSEPDQSGDKDALTMTSEALLALGENGTVYPVHRLDRVVGGVMMIARSKRGASELCSLISERAPAKEYIAVVEGVPEEGVYENFLRKDARRGMALICDSEEQGAKSASLSLSVIESAKTDRGEKSLVYLKLQTGRFHQIRAQLSSRRHPVVGDGKYGSRDKCRSGIALFSCRIALSLANEKIEAKAMPQNDYPWSLFSGKMSEGFIV